MRPDRYTAIGAGFGALMGVKGMPTTSALAYAAGLEAVAQYAERRCPGVTGGTGGSSFEKALVDVGATMLAFWLVRRINR